MTELWLKYRDEYGEDRKIRVEGSKFSIGRHSGCDLAVPNNRLSREHVKIESFGEVSVISDCGSSNGTTLNGADLSEPTALRNGDRLNLGGGLDIEVEIVADQPRARKSYASADNSADNPSQSQSAAGTSSIPTAVFIAAPLLAFVFLICGGGLLYVFNSGGGNNSRNTDLVYNPTPEKTTDETPEDTPDSPSPKTSPTAGGTTVSPSPESTVSPQSPPPLTDEKVKIDKNSAAFLSRIGTNDPNPFLKTEQIETVGSRIAAFKGSSNLAENLKAVKSSASEIESLAKSKGLKGQFLAIAALAQIGNQRGNPLETAKQMLPFLADLRVSLGNALADDNLLIMADYPRRSANRKGSLQGVLEAIPKMKDIEKADAREIRTIWYLKRNKKISDEGYELALRFLAVGTISQNPKDFDVNAEAVIFN